MKKSDIIIVLSAILIIAAAIFLVSRSDNHPISRAAANEMLPIITHATVKSSADNLEVETRLPFSKKGAPNEILEFNISVLFKDGQTTKFKVIPDDCVEEFTVNDRAVAADGNLPPGHCNWKVGFIIDLKPFLQEGSNSVYIKVRNKNGPTGLRFTPILPARR